ncbi:hypothetical protein BHYA_0134g00130 [Botrytis hyacinthi]|uniref:Uncharacterized protein n=1 Tax=Botrytis hyacinthi TaxID=278943 RepID=A0A4Z1GKX2_9HELO|nr:hypothetical protein BHYA_0134g00130 [Botrytis hyacinthi]
MQNGIHHVESAKNAGDQAYSWGKVALVTMIPEPIKTHSACHSLPILKVTHVNRVEIEALAIEPDVIGESKLKSNEQHKWKEVQTYKLVRLEMVWKRKLQATPQGLGQYGIGTVITY